MKKKERKQPTEKEGEREREKNKKDRRIETLSAKGEEKRTTY